MEKENVLLIFGGNSFEHDISILTALTIYNKSRASKYKLWPLYLSKSNEWFLFLKDNLNINNFKNFNNNKKDGFKEAEIKDGFILYKQGLFTKKLKVIAGINCCHGGVGENGELTAYFNFLNIPITSGNVLSQTVGMDKVISKYVFSMLNMPVVKFFKFTKNDLENNKEQIIKKIERLDFPLILKPSQLGSSIGIEVVKNIDEFFEKAQTVLLFDNEILVEKAILNNLKEFNVAVMKRQGKTIVSSVDEPKRKDEILSFKDKYIGEDGINISSQKIKERKSGGAYVSSTVFTESLSDKQKTRLKEISKKIYEELDFLGPVRIDFLMDDKNKIYVNEINTVPGSLAYYFFVPTYFKSVNNFVEEIVNEAIVSYQNKTKIKKEYITKLI